MRGNYSDEGGIERLTGEDRLERREERLALLAKRGQIASDARECCSAAGRTKAARDFLLDLEHAQVVLGLVVVEGDRQVVEEGQDLLLAEPELLEEIAGR